MTRQDAINLKDSCQIEKILHEIRFKASHGCNKWEGIVFEELYEIKKYFTDHGFVVSPALSTKTMPVPFEQPVLTISW